MMNMIMATFVNLDPMNKENLLKSLTILWQGLLAIFVVIALVILAVSVTTDIITRVNNYKAKNGDISLKNIFKKK